MPPPEFRTHYEPIIVRVFVCRVFTGLTVKFDNYTEQNRGSVRPPSRLHVVLLDKTVVSLFSAKLFVHGHVGTIRDRRDDARTTDVGLSGDGETNEW